MKIIQIMPEFGLAGAEIMCENLTIELIKAGHEVVVISMYDFHSVITERLEDAGVQIIYLNKKAGLDLSMILKMQKVFRKINPDVIHTHRYCPQYAIPAAMMAGVKRRVHTVHNIAKKENSKLARIANRFFFKCCHVIPVALSELIRDTIIKEYRMNKDNIPVIFNGIDLSKCMPKTDYSITGKFRILHIGRFAEQKNHVDLLKAFKIFHDKHSESELLLIGDGEKRMEIEKYVNENDLTSSVIFLGLQNNVYRYLHEADIFALSSNYEGMPMTLIEAMGTGLPIVATAVGGIPDMLDIKSATIVDVDVDEIVKAFENYYGDKDQRSCHGKNALRKAEDFSAKTMAERYIKVYRL